MTVHERPVGATVEWYTPPDLFDALGLDFDLDPAAPLNLPHWIPAANWYAEDGELLPWHGRVWLNPPYGKLLPAFVDRMCAHADGVMLTAARTETQWWQKAAGSADLIVFLRDRLHFIRNDGFQARSSFASTLFGWGDECCAALWRADLGHRSRASSTARLRLPTANGGMTSGAAPRGGSVAVPPRSVAGVEAGWERRELHPLAVNLSTKEVSDGSDHGRTSASGMAEIRAGGSATGRRCVGRLRSHDQGCCPNRAW